MTPSIFRHKFTIRLATLFAITLSLTACTMDENTAKVSDDLNALRKIIKLPNDLTSGRWEIFGTPEYTGGVPGPTDYMTLVAEIKLPAGASTLPTSSDSASVFIVPEAARPWISAEFRSVLEKHKNATLDLEVTKNCQPYSAKLTQTNNPVSGFSCTTSDRVFLYLSLL
jgi:hypothetical protein